MKTLNPIDEAKAFKKYVYDNGWGSVSKLASKLGKSFAYITKRIMLLDLPSDVTKAIIINLISFGERRRGTYHNSAYQNSKFVST